MKTARINFKAKLISVYNMDDTLAYQYIPVPTLTRSHCDMSAFRQHGRYGSYANSDLFPGVLARIRASQFHDTVNGSVVIKLDNVPAGVKVDTSKFLATVSFEV